MYSGLGLSAIVFIIHGIALHGWDVQNHRMALKWMGIMAALNLVGAATYAARVRLCQNPFQMATIRETE